MTEALKAALSKLTDGVRRVTGTSDLMRLEEMADLLENSDWELPISEGFRNVLYGDGVYRGAFTLPEGLNELRDYAFYNCDDLTSVTFPASLISIGDSAFYKCLGLTSVTFGESLTSIGDGAFYRCESLTSVTFGDSLISIGDYAFYECLGLTSVTFGESLTSIGDSAFYLCSGLTNIYCRFPEGQVSGAPWGATNATIHYDYTGE